MKRRHFIKSIILASGAAKFSFGVAGATCIPKTLESIAGLRFKVESCHSEKSSKSRQSISLMLTSLNSKTSSEGAHYFDIEGILQELILVKTKEINVYKVKIDWMLHS